ncbi:MAG TPA: hypothetical protein VFV66_34450, partial [Nonomuraea sp.]|nr:hypothetical protein [Nonomuraea sp.]
MSGLPLYVSYTIAPDSSAQAQTFTMSMTPPAGDTRTFRCHLYDEQGVRKTTFDNADGVRIMTTPISLAHYPGNKITARLGVGADTRDVVIPLVFANGVAKALDG